MLYDFKAKVIDKIDGKIIRIKTEKVKTTKKAAKWMKEQMKKGKFGRFISEIYYADNPEYLNDLDFNRLTNLNDELVKEGHARYQEY